MIRALVLVTVLSACTTVPAQQQWTAPAAAFQLTIPAGWGSLDVDGVAEGTQLLLIPEAEGAQCYVHRRNRWESSLTQSEVNANFAEGARPNAIRAGATRLRFESAPVDGVHVITNAALSPETGARYIQRRFMITEAGNITSYEIECRADRQMSDVIANDMDAFVLSLRFAR